MTAPDSPVPWTKAIPEARDRLQSRILVWIAVPVLCYSVFSEFQRLYQMGLLGRRFMAVSGRTDDTVGQILAVSAIFALASWRRKTATPFAASIGGIICLLVTLHSSWGNGYPIAHSGLAPLFLLFVLTFEATRLGRKHKEAAGLAESRKGRNAAQVIANLGIAAFYGSVWGVGVFGSWGYATIGSYQGSDGGAHAYMAVFSLPVLAAFAEATADTVSSEIGQAFGGRPFMLTTLRRVAPGTDGAITLIGTLAGILAAAIIAASGAPAMGMSARECLVAFVAGVLGLFFYSLLGATFERRGWLGNDLVNFLSTAFAAAVSLLAIRLFNYTLFR
jgi:uncharacterized protein (TIGR00297 family)